MTDTIRKRTVNRAAETRRKSAERQRRREAGEVRCELWLDGRDQAYVKVIGDTFEGGLTNQQAISYALAFTAAMKMKQ